MEASKLSQLWDALRQSNQESLAPRLVGHGIRSFDDIVRHLDLLMGDGIQQWQLETIIATQAPQLAEVPVRERSDFPAPYQGKRASLAHALEAAAPNNRKQSLEALDFDVLSRSSDVWRLQDGWLPECGGLLLGDFTSYQMRHLRTDVDGITRRCIKDCVRSIRRGLGVTALKDAFDARLMVNIPVLDDTIPFSFSEVGHLRDASLIAV